MERQSVKNRYAIEGFDGKKVLIVDDEQFVSVCLARNFERFGVCDIKEVTSGNLARQLIESGLTPDIILSDLNMYDGTGKDLFEWLRQNKPEILDRFIIASGGDTGAFSGFLSEMRERGRILDKPFNIQELRMKVLEVLSSSGRADVQ